MLGFETVSMIWFGVNLGWTGFSVLTCEQSVEAILVFFYKIKTTDTRVNIVKMRPSKKTIEKLNISENVEQQTLQKVEIFGHFNWLIELHWSTFSLQKQSCEMFVKVTLD